MALFAKEEELVSAFTARSGRFLNNFLNKSISRYFLLQEFDSYFGIADIVLGTYRPYISKKTIRKSINLNWLIPLLSLKKGWAFSTAEFMEEFGISKGLACNYLKQYVEANFIKKNKPGRYKVAKEYEPVADTVISIEAKLTNWKRALKQAHRYKKFSDFSFVLLDEARANSALENLIIFEKENIGLITMDEKRFTVHTSPTRNSKKRTEYCARINEAAFEYFIDKVTAC